MTITSNDSAPLVVVVGATGQQGGSVCAALKGSSQPYRVRALSRDPTKPSALAIAADGAELFKVDLSADNAPAARTAFAGADIAFVVTNWVEHMSMEKEVADAKMMIEAAEAGGAKRIIWSGLPSLATASGGKYPHVYHFEGKAQVTEWGRAKFASTDVAFVNVDSGCYAQNMTSHWLIYKRNPLTFALHTPLSMMLPIIDIRDYGRFVLEAVQHPFYATGGEINAAAEWVTAEQIVKDVSNATQKSIACDQTRGEVEEYLKSMNVPPVAIIDLLESWEAFADPKVRFYGGKQLTTPATFKPASWKEFVGGYNWDTAFAN